MIIMAAQNRSRIYLEKEMKKEKNIMIFIFRYIFKLNILNYVVKLFFYKF